MADPFAPDSLTTVINEARQRARERAREAARDAARREIGALASPARRAAASPPSRAAALPIPEPAKEGPIALRLPNGRRVNAVLSPGVARRSDVAAIARASADNNRRAFGALQAQGTAIESLKRSHEELAEKIGRLEKRADEAVLAITETFTQSTRQLKQLAAQGQKVLAQTGTAATAAVGQLKQVQALAVTQQAQNLTNVIGSAQATAYGDRGSVLTTNNLLLTGNQLFWTFLAPLSQVFGASRGTSMLLGVLAPFGSLLTGFAAVGSRVSERKPERFISDIAVFDIGSVEYRESLRSRMDDDAFETFRKRTNVPVTVNSIDPIAPDQASAEVKDGELHIVVVTFPFPRTARVPPRFRIAWMVDTGAEGG
jgi:hypothetical protein